MKYTPEVIRDWFKQLEAPNKELTSWEVSFVESVSDQFTRSGSLSDRQIEILEKIYAEKTN